MKAPLIVVLGHSALAFCLPKRAPDAQWLLTSELQGPDMPEMPQMPKLNPGRLRR
ncbi:MAG: hypothetical protein ACXVAF_07785 [Vulcanimicrobiaceae bacterium]